MFELDKQKKNRFRKLIPQSHPPQDSEKLSQLTILTQVRQTQTSLHSLHAQRATHLRQSKNITIDRPKDISQSMEKSKGKQFVFERRMRTISSLQQKEEDYYKHSSSLADYNYERVKQQKKQSTRSIQPINNPKLLSLIMEFKSRTDQIFKIQSLQEIQTLDGCEVDNCLNQQDYQQKLQNLVSFTHQSSAKLLSIYINRLILSKLQSSFTLFLVFTPEQSDRASDQTSNQSYIQIQMIPSQDLREGQRKDNCRQKLINVNKFFSSK